MNKRIPSLDEFINESKAGKDFELKDLKVGMEIKVETHAGIYQSAKIDSIKNDMICWTAKNGNTGCNKYGSKEISLPTYESNRFINEEKIDAKADTALNKQIELTNKWIEQAKQDDQAGIEPDGTWESVYVFQPVVRNNQFVTIKYTEPYHKNKETKDRYNVNDWSSLDDLKWVLNWIIRSIKKGYKDDGFSIPNVK